MTASGQRVGFLCIKCNYPLYGLPEHRCPECGQPFDPNDIETVNTGKALGPWTRRMLRPPGKWFHGFVLLGVLAMLVALTPPGYYCFILTRTLPALYVLGTWWTLRVVLFVFVSIRYRQPLRLRRKTWLVWQVAPAMAMTLAWAAELRLPQRAAFAVSRPAMDRLAQRVMADPANTPQGGWVGVFPIGSVRPVLNGMKFSVRGAGLFGEHSFAYTNNLMEPLDPAPCMAEHVTGAPSWWMWSGL